MHFCFATVSVPAIFGAGHEASKAASPARPWMYGIGASFSGKRAATLSVAFGSNWITSCFSVSTIRDFSSMIFDTSRSRASETRISTVSPPDSPPPTSVMLKLLRMVARYGVVGRSGGSASSARAGAAPSAMAAAAMFSARAKSRLVFMRRSSGIEAATLGEKWELKKGEAEKPFVRTRWTRVGVEIDTRAESRGVTAGVSRETKGTVPPSAFETRWCVGPGSADGGTVPFVLDWGAAARIPGNAVRARERIPSVAI